MTSAGEDDALGPETRMCREGSTSVGRLVAGLAGRWYNGLAGELANSVPLQQDAQCD